MKVLSRAQWNNEVERMYGWFAYYGGEPFSMRIAKRALLSLPAYCVGVVLDLVDQGKA